MKIKVYHLWILAVISYILALIMSFSQIIVGTIVFSILYLSLLISTKWVS